MLLLVGGLAQSWWRRRKEDPELNAPAAAAIGCLAAVATQGCFDVPMHAPVVGFAVVIMTGRGGVERKRVGIYWGGRAVMTGLALLMAWQLASFPSRSPRPIGDDFSLEHPPHGEDVRAWLRYRPLDDRCVEALAHQALRERNWKEGERAFELLYRLDPHSPLPPMRAFAAWSRVQHPVQAARAVEVAMERPPLEDAPRRFRESLHASRDQSEQFAALMALPVRSAAIQVVRMEFVVDAMLGAELNRFLALREARPDEPLSADTVGRLFLLVDSRLGEKEGDMISRQVPEHPKVAARAQAEWAAKNWHFERAGRIVIEKLSPIFPSASSDYSPQVLAAWRPNWDMLSTLELATQEWRAGKIASSESMLRSVIRQHNAPPQAWYLLGRIEWENGNFEKAWVFLENFLKREAPDDPNFSSAPVALPEPHQP